MNLAFPKGLGVKNIGKEKLGEGYPRSRKIK